MTLTIPIGHESTDPNLQLILLPLKLQRIVNVQQSFTVISSLKSVNKICLITHRCKRKNIASFMAIYNWTMHFVHEIHSLVSLSFFKTES